MEKYFVTIDQLSKNKIASIFFVYLFIPLTPLIAFEARDHLLIDSLAKSCYKDTKSCKSVLIKIHSYQKNAAINKKFSCQTRLLGLEANLIMAMNYNLKIKEAQNIIQAVKKYC
mgnify:CR=1 FL=1